MAWWHINLDVDRDEKLKINFMWIFPCPLGDQFLASASRDRMVHIFQCVPGQMGYQHVQSLPDHSAAVTAVKFAPSKDSGLQLLSSGADKSIIFHSLEKVRDLYNNYAKEITSSL